jgi:hypothetical protein
MRYEVVALEAENREERAGQVGQMKYKVDLSEKPL